MDPKHMRRILRDLNRAGIPEMLRQADEAMSEQNRRMMENEALQETVRNANRFAQERRQAMAGLPNEATRRQLEAAAQVASSPSFQAAAQNLERMSELLNSRLDRPSRDAARRISEDRISKSEESIEKAMQEIDQDGLDTLLREGSGGRNQS